MTDTRVPILLYHKLGRPPRGARVAGHYVSPALFRRHLAYLRARGYESVALQELARPRSPLPTRPVVITFDDGYRCVYEHAVSALAEYGYTATVFMVAGGLGRTNYWETVVGDVEEPMLTPHELRQIQAAGLEIGSHTVHHPRLTQLAPEEAERELCESKTQLEDLLGAPCRTLAYPYGDWNQQVRDYAAEAGYEVACTTVRAAARAEDDALALPRINIRRYNVVPRFALKLWQAGRRRA